MLRKICKLTDQKTKLGGNFYLVMVDKGVIFQNLEVVCGYSVLLVRKSCQVWSWFSYFSRSDKTGRCVPTWSLVKFAQLKFPVDLNKLRVH